MLADVARPLLYALCAVATILAWRLAKTRPYHRPVAAVLAIGLCTDLLREATDALILASAPTPYTGLARYVWFADVAALLAHSAAVVALSLRAFTRRSPWPAVAAWALASVAVAVQYPRVRGEALVALFGLWQGAGVVVSVVLVARWFRLREWPLSHRASALAFIGAEVAALAPHVGGEWALAWPGYAVLWGGLIWAHLRVWK